MNLVSEEQPKIKKIRPAIIAFAIFSVFILYQPPGIGTIVGAASLGLTLLLCFLPEKGVIRITLKWSTLSLLLFLVIVSALTLVKYEIVEGYLKFAGQIILCIVLGSFTITKKESGLIRQIFLTAIAVYAVFIIIECVETIETRYSHSDILLFGAEFDPNYIGIPLVTGTALALERVLKAKWRILYAAVYLLCVVAIVFTGSRGNFVGLAASNGLVFLTYLGSRKIKPLRKILLLIIVAVGLFFLFRYVTGALPDQWERMASITAASDNGRYELWKTAFKAWKSRPFFGNGFRSMLLENGTATHNTYLQLLAETGAVGTLLFLGFLIPAVINAFRCESTLGSVALAMLLQIAFLDALDTRAVWVVFIWLALLPGKFGEEEQKTGIAEGTELEEANVLSEPGSDGIRER